MQWKICWSEDNRFAPAQKYLGDIAVHYDPLEKQRQTICSSTENSLLWQKSFFRNCVKISYFYSNNHVLYIGILYIYLFSIKIYLH